MAEVIWVLLDGDGNELRATPPFPTKEDAEAWMGSEWQALADEGAEFVSLRIDGVQEYKMSLSEA